ncbi:aldo/keto reductase family protein [Sinomonas sp. ASV322]|uniref:aldo/keto reductase family protein n=1 Tax=Sinomonas sp. ASV322 TaxID=3041920 RepID=UPI0027DC6794|nr:aldo/keto reductase family protein [Sinomonas sp. ASV322]MDQ4503586.1 aldo/keto reductase family protein [Sinomonas sp. ASV322]
MRGNPYNDGGTLMRYRKLGSSDLEVSEISLGSWLTFSGGVEAEATRACTEAAFDVGITFFDTANVYGRGAAETAWGDILSKHPRDSYVLATKVFGQMSDTESGLSAEQISKQIDASLTRLKTDYVDLYQAHRFDSSVPIEETVEAFQKVVEQGKARYLGFSEWTPEQIQAAIDIAGPDLFVSSQPQYSMLWQAPEAEVFPLCEANGISQIVWSPLAQGVLTGKYRPGQPVPEGSRFASETMSGSMDRLITEPILEAVERLAPIAESAGLSLPTLALAWVLRRGELASAITGASRPEQVRANASASGIELGDDVLAAIDEALDGVAVKGPTLAPYAQTGIMHRG